MIIWRKLLEKKERRKKRELMRVLSDTWGVFFIYFCSILLIHLVKIVSSLYFMLKKTIQSKIKGRNPTIFRNRLYY